MQEYLKSEGQWASHLMLFHVVVILVKIPSLLIVHNNITDCRYFKKNKIIRIMWSQYTELIQTSINFIYPLLSNLLFVNSFHYFSPLYFYLGTHSFMLWRVCNKTMYNIIYYIVRKKKQSYNAIIVKKKNCIIVITLLIFTEFEGITIFYSEIV